MSPRILLGISLVLWNRLLLKLRLRQPKDGWRIAAGLALRGETARFVLSSFNLKFLREGDLRESAQQILADRLTEFLKYEKTFNLLIEHLPDCDRVVPDDKVSYSLRFEKWVDGPARFIRPERWTDSADSPPGVANLFQFVVRISPDDLADVWVRVNHVGTDGVPTQEMLTRLEQAWGVAKPVVVPSIDEFEPFTVARPTPGRPDTVEVQTFIDFGPLLAWRKRENGKLSEPMTLGAAMLWQLARHDRFASLYAGTTVDVPAMNGIPRGVGVVVVHPAKYHGRPNGLAEFVKEFNRQLALTKSRKSENWSILNSAAHLSPRLEESLLRHALDDGTSAFGSLGLTIIKEAKIFVAPLGDAGHADGFLALGSTTLDSTDGKKLGCVTVKGPRARVQDYAMLLRQALNTCG